jgi:uncharacterized membrane protein
MSKRRVYFLDWLRGIAVLGMVFHHGLYALEQVSYMFGRPIVFDFLQTQTFFLLQQIFVGVFLVISGICTAFSRSVLRRGLIISGAAALITLVTAYLLPRFGIEGLEIWFGILHMFGLSMLLYGLFTCRKKWVSFLAAAGLFCLWFAIITHRGDAWAQNALAVVGLAPVGFFSADYYPLIPYFFLFLAGTFIGPAVRDGKLPGWFYKWRIRPIEWVGRNSLWIYILHQPLFFGLFFLIYYLM